MADCNYLINGKTLSKEQFLEYVKTQSQDEISNVTPLMKKKVGEFSSSHFDEKNIITHLRMNTRTDAEGNKVLFIEELQSDWGQQGKKEGFNLTSEQKSKLIEEHRKVLSDLQELDEKIIANVESGNKDKSLYDLSQQKIKLQEKSESLKDQIFRDKAPQAPFVTDTNAWTKLGLKVALKEAVKQGATKIAWTTGEQQNERYDLSNTLESVTVTNGKKGERLVYVRAKNNSDAAYKVDDNGIITESGKNNLTGNVDGKRLEDVVGKDLTDKVMSKSEAISNFHEATKPQSIRELADNIFGTKMASSMPLEVVDGGVLAASNHNQIRESIISFLPVDVVNILRSKQLTPNDLFNNKDMVFSQLSVDERLSVGKGVVGAIRKTGTLLRTELSDFGKTGRERFLIPTLKASNLNAREIAGIVSGSGIFHLDSSTLPKEGTSTTSIAESFSKRLGGASKNELSATALANLLNVHNNLIDVGKDSSLRSKYQTSDENIIQGDDFKVTSKGMKGFYGSPNEGGLGIVGNVAKSLFKQEPKTVEITTRENISSNDKIYEAYDRNGNLIKRGNSEAYIKSIAEQNNGTYRLVDAKQTSTQHSIDITPELKAQVEQGLPLFMRTAKGEVFGFQKGDKIYLDPSLMNADTPIHEVVGHYGMNIIDTMANGGDVRAKAVIQKGMMLLEATEGKAVLDEIKDNPAYSNLPIREQKLEALATIIGREGANMFTEGTRKNTFASKVKDFIKSFYDYIRTKVPTLKDKTIEQIVAMDNKEFVRAIVGDAFRGEIVDNNEDKFISSPKITTDEKGNIVLNRLRQEEEQGRSRSGEINALATILLARVHKSVQDTYGKDSREAVAISNEEEAYLEDFAKEQGVPKTDLQEAERKLKDAWGKYLSNGISFDGMAEAEKERQLIVALLGYLKAKGIDIAKGISNDVRDFIKNKFSGVTDEMIDVAQGRMLTDYQKLYDIHMTPKNKEALDGLIAQVKSGEMSMEDFINTIDNIVPNERIKNVFISYANEQIDPLNGYVAVEEEIEEAPESPKAETSKEEERAFIGGLLARPINSKNFPSIVGGNKTDDDILKRITAVTQEDVQDRKVMVDTSYVRVALEDIKEIALQNANALYMQFGEDWQNKVMDYLSDYLNAANPAQAIGILNVISTDVQQKIEKSQSPTERTKLFKLQDKSDELSILFASQASLGINARKILRQFAQGGNMSKLVLDRILTEDTIGAIEEINKIVSSNPTNEELNSVSMPAQAPQTPKSRMQKIKENVKAALSSNKKKKPKITEQEIKELGRRAEEERKRQGVQTKMSRQQIAQMLKEEAKKC